MQPFLYYYHRAKESVRHGRLQLALGYLHRCISENPDFYDAYYLLSDVFQKLGRMEDALRIVQKLDNALGFDAEVKRELARMEFVQGRPRKALTHLKKLLKKDPRNADAHYLMGEIYRQSGRVDKANESYTLCLEYNPSHAGAKQGVNTMMRASLEHSAGDNEEGLPRARVGEDHIETRLSEAGRELEQGNADRAIAALRLLYKDHPQNEMVALPLAAAQETKGDLEGAVATLEGFLQEQPGSVMGHFQSGRLLNQLSRYDQAIEHLKEALEIDPQYFEARFELAVSYHWQGNAPEAEKQYLSAAELMPGDVRPLVNLGHLLMTRHRYRDGEEVLRKALEIRPSCQEALELLGSLYIRASRPNQAAKCYEALLSLNDSHLVALKNLATIRQTQNYFDSALKLWRRVARLDPDNPSITQRVAELEGVLARPGSRGKEDEKAR